MTPYEKLKSLPDAETFLKPGLSFHQLDEIAFKQSDNEAARLLKQARQELFQSIHQPRIAPPKQAHPPPTLQAHF
jgi:hypothetical protein